MSVSVLTAATVVAVLAAGLAALQAHHAPSVPMLCIAVVLGTDVVALFLLLGLLRPAAPERPTSTEPMLTDLSAES
ncbi:hypothetical protein ACWT_0277 [Actinoplanes sp. SE50]|nr:hypothetical protein ACPL_392 [Actinoplanes sp. SE50/110]ATO79692.1 hypothetical protein ACWT_0277 [Actinoplanes sp. SE50]SLL97095.1 hypothetical protein ACSP50_0291 [Actinoplanes sp. SE50/110]